MDRSKNIISIKKLIQDLGDDPEREGLKKTPSRFLDSLQELTSGYHEKIEEVFNEAFFEESYSEMVIVRDIEFYSLCEHHLLPFFGRCHVGYIPNKKVIGLSKIPRIVDIFSRRLQVQERLTVQIGETLQEALNPQGVGVIMEAVHLCMTMRGVQKQNSLANTSCMLGCFLDEKTRHEFITLTRPK